MKKFFYTIFSVLMLVCLAACGQAKPASFENSETKEISSGPIIGKKDLDNGVIEWLGIPYAAAPVGDLRWKEPQPVEKWTEPLDVTSYGPNFIQLSQGEVTGTESALNLDLVRPDSEEAGLPVLVFVHGGNNQTGHAQEIKGNTFVRDVNAVYVSVNYRLGALGFNPLPSLKTGSAEEQSGNFALLDIAAALDWVKENIEVFGGDKNNITLAGFSAGGRDVMATLISPLFKDKYQKAISFSGGMTLADEKESQEIFAAAIAPLVVEDGKKSSLEEAQKWLLTSESDVADYLYSLSAERLVPLMGNAMIRMSVFPHLYKDGVLIPEEGFETSQYNDVPLLLVTGTSEFSLFAAFDPYFASSVGDGSLFTDENKQKEFTFAETYGSALYRLSNTVDSARLMAGTYQSPIYIAEIAYGDDISLTPSTGQFLGAFHGVFEPLLQTPSNYSAFIGEDFEVAGAQELSRDFKNYIKEFLVNGNPNADELPQWQEWTKDTNQVLKMDANAEKAMITTETDAETADDIIAAIQSDTSLTKEVKQKLVDQVLNGRWFSQPIEDLIVP